MTTFNNSDEYIKIGNNKGIGKFADRGAGGLYVSDK
jgi:hypothetical protein